MDSSTTNLSTILSHPLRLSLYELIRDGARTTPELAEILNVNRINLYHHLNKMEESGLLVSSYTSQRVKQFRIKEESPSQNISNPRNFTSTHTIVLTEPKISDANATFQKQGRAMARNYGQSVPDNHKIIQIHLFTQPIEINKSKQEKLNQVKFKRSQK